MQIVQRMFCVTFPAGSTILLQNAQPAAEDCMYYLAEGQAEVVIMGTVDAASKQGTGGSMRAAASQSSLQLRQPPPSP